MKTTVQKPGEVRKAWTLVDAADQPLGRVASQVALLLRGKHRPAYTPHANDGDFVIVVNAEKIKLTGNKLNDKMAKRYSGYPGGLRFTPFAKLMAEKPEAALERAVWGMLPHGRQGRKQLRALKVYRGAAHPHEAQQPKAATYRSGRLVTA